MPSAAKSIEELFPLIEFCKAGNLSAVAKWIAEGKPLNPPQGKKTRRASPLQIAIEKGFLTLAEVLIDGGADPCADGGNALNVAVKHRRADIAALLLDRGVPLDSVGFKWVCYSADPDLIKLFLNRGASPVDGHPFYHGFVHCLNPMLGAYKTQLERFPELRIQADMALCHYAKEGNLRCVSLLLWAGARADAQIPEDEGVRNEYAGSCALEEAIELDYSESLATLAQLYWEGDENGIVRKQDESIELMRQAVERSVPGTVEVLLTMKRAKS